MKFFSQRSHLHFKSARNVSWMLMLVLLSLSGCFRPESRTGESLDGDDSTSAAATFIVEQISGDVKSTEMHKEISLPASRTFQFNACVRDKRTQESLIGQRFMLEGGTSSTELRANEEGCVLWSENVKFNYLGEEKYIPIQRKLIAKGSHTGSRVLKLAINPWNRQGSHPTVVDLKKAPLEAQYLVSERDASLYLQGKFAKNDKKNLMLLESVRVLNEEAPSGATRFESEIKDRGPGRFPGLSRRLTLSVLPKLRLTGLEGQFVYQILRRVPLKAEVTLIQEKANKKGEVRSIVWQTRTPLPLAFENDVFRVQFVPTLRQGQSADRLLFAVRIFVEKGLEGVQPFEALYEIGSVGDFLSDSNDVLALTEKISNADSNYQNSEFVRTLSYQEFNESSETTGAGAGDESEGSISGGSVSGPGVHLRQSGSVTGSTSSEAGESGVQVQSPRQEMVQENNERRKAVGANAVRTLPGPVAHGTATSRKTVDPSKKKILPSQFCATSKDAETAPLKRFQFTKLEAQWGQEDEASTQTLRTVIYSGKVCLRDMSRGGKSAAGEWFKVTYPDGRTARVQAKGDQELPNNVGCLMWNGKLTHKFYESERFYLEPVTIEHGSGFKETRHLAIYPWNNYFMNRLDMSNEAECKVVENVNLRKSIPSLLILDNIKFDMMDRQYYKVDRFMSIKPIRKIMLRTFVKTPRLSNIMEGRGTNYLPIRDGVVLVRAAIIAEGTDIAGQNFETIAPMVEGPRLVAVRGGELKILASFPIPDLRLLRTRANMIIEVRPIDESKLTHEERMSPGEYKGDPMSLIDDKTGLVTPTYAGPISMKEESGSVTMYPTSDLRNAYVDDSTRVSRLADIKIDELLERAEAQQRDYEKLAHKESQLFNLLYVGNYEYVALENETLIQEQDPRLVLMNRSLPHKNAAEKILKTLNMGAVESCPSEQEQPSRFAKFFGLASKSCEEKLTRSDLKDLIEGRRKLDERLAKGFCALFMKEMFEKMSPDGIFLRAGSNAYDYRNYAYKKCVSAVEKQGIGEAFVFERKARTFEVGKAMLLKSPKMRFSVSADVSVSSAESFSEGVELGIGTGTDLLRMFDGGLRGGVPRAGTARANPAIRLLSAIPNVGGVKFGGGMGWTFSRSSAHGASFGSSVAITREMLEVRLPLLRYETCGAIRINPKFWETRRQMATIINKKISPEQAMAIMTRGILICSGTISSEPWIVRERYYNLDDSSGDNIVADSGDFRNYPWFLTIRGTGDFNAFLDLLQGRPIKSPRSDIPDSVDVGNLPPTRFEEAYKGKAFTVPGVYTVDGFTLPPKKE